MKSVFAFITFLIMAYCFGELTEEQEKGAYKALYTQSVGAYAGDMMLSPGQKAAMRSRVAINNWAMRWTDNYMPYYIDPSNILYSPSVRFEKKSSKVCSKEMQSLDFVKCSGLSAYKDVIDQAAQHIEDATWGCVQVRPWNGETNYVNIYYGVGCNSPIGMRGGMQNISLGLNCQPFGTIVHEMMHALGFDHEQNRPDRDNYLTIYWNNIQTGLNYSFTKQTDWWTWTDFDFDSIMIYGNNAFSKDPKLPTMTAKDDPNRVILHPYQRTEMTASDVYQIEVFYGCA